MADESGAAKAGEGEGAAAPKASKPLIPIIAGALSGAVVSFAVTQFVLIPKINKAALSANGGAVAAAEAPAAAAGHGEEKKEEAHGGGGHGDEKKDGKDAKDGSKATYTKDGWSVGFPTVTANLSGSLGRQYLKCSFQIVSDDKTIGSVVEENKGKLKDVVLSVLGSRSLADVESSSAKEVLRKELVVNLNKALNSSTIKQVQFTDFLIQ